MSKKLKLDLDALEVESFASDEAQSERGTVHGLGRETDPRACPGTANWNCSVGDGCTWGPYTCNVTCPAECHYTDGYDSCRVCIG
jgi:hypothetical protein